jgi:hypothetical protein
MVSQAGYGECNLVAMDRGSGWHHEPGRQQRAMLAHQVSNRGEQYRLTWARLAHRRDQRCLGRKADPRVAAALRMVAGRLAKPRTAIRASTGSGIERRVDGWPDHAQQPKVDDHGIRRCWLVFEYLTPVALAERQQHVQVRADRDCDRRRSSADVVEVERLAAASASQAVPAPHDAIDLE